MQERQRLKDMAWGESLNESIMVSEKDFRDRAEDVEKRRARQHFLTTYTRANKEVGESSQSSYLVL